MTATRPVQALAPPARNRLAQRADDVALVQGASVMITDLGLALDRQLLTEPRATERLRMLRETTNRIIRTANDAVHAYRRASAAVSAELARPDTDGAAADGMRVLLDDARGDVLRVLEVAKRRYPWADDATSPAGEGTAQPER